MNVVNERTRDLAMNENHWKSIATDVVCKRSNDAGEDAAQDLEESEDRKEVQWLKFI